MSSSIPLIQKMVNPTLLDCLPPEIWEVGPVCTASSFPRSLPRFISPTSYAGALFFQDHADAMEALMAEACSQRRKPQLAFVGATLPDSIVETAVSMVRPDSDPGLAQHVVPYSDPRLLAIPYTRLHMGMAMSASF